ncbi:hypothetical protein [Flavobacterium sp.]
MLFAVVGLAVFLAVLVVAFAVAVFVAVLFTEAAFGVPDFVLVLLAVAGFAVVFAAGLAVFAAVGLVSEAFVAFAVGLVAAVVALGLAVAVLEVSVLVALAFAGTVFFDFEVLVAVEAFLVSFFLASAASASASDSKPKKDAMLLIKSMVTVFKLINVIDITNLER